MGFFFKKALLEIKMRCVNPAGFPPKWLRGISMHGLGKRWPEAPRFNYDFRRVLGGWWGGGTPEMAERGRSGELYYDGAPSISSCNSAHRGTGVKKVINTAREHTSTHACTH